MDKNKLSIGQIISVFIYFLIPTLLAVFLNFGSAGGNTVFWIFGTGVGYLLAIKHY